MGRHEAAEGASPHPLVAAALAGRPASAGGHRDEPRGTAEEGELGWPGDEPAPGSGGLGWPDSATEEQAASSRTEGAGPAGTSKAAPRRGWRRLFGAAPAA